MRWAGPNQTKQRVLAVVVAVLFACAGGSAIGCTGSEGSGPCAGPPVAEADHEHCTDGCDDDDDGRIDCADSGCALLLFCSCPASTEASAAACEDGCDNDRDGAADCADVECNGVGFCRPRLDGGTSCASAPEGSELRCEDTCDNDADGLVDCSDPGCAGLAGCPGMGLPDGGRSDASCPFVDESTTFACSDACDDDRDGRSDCADPDCQTRSVCCGAGVEEGETACADDCDNDDDGSLDCADPTCVETRACLTCTADAECQDPDPCNGSERCVDSRCAPPLGVTDCDDMDACTLDTCTGAVGCVHACDAARPVCACPP